MARIRSIKPELRTSITVSLWPREVRYFFVLLWGYLDDYGRGVDDELLIASDCFPRDRDVTPERVDGWLELIAEAGPLCRYEVDGRNYLHAPNWREHQKPSHPTRSKVPPCPDDEPDGFKAWREANPQRLKNRSRTSRENLQKIHTDAPSTPGGASGRGVDVATGGRGHPNGGVGGDQAEGRVSHEEPAAQGPEFATPESLTNSSGNAPEHFVPEQGSKGAREQGSKGAGGCGGGGIQRSEPQPAGAGQRPDGLHTIPDDFYLNDTMRRWAASTVPQLDADFETQQFISYWRSEGRRKRNWHDAWQKWMRDSAQRTSQRQRQPSNVIALASGQPLPGTDANLAGWGAVAASLAGYDTTTEDSA
jgi:hypothetical protein